MIKNILFIVIFSVLVLLFMPQVSYGLRLLADFHHWVAGLLGQVFAGDQMGRLISSSIALILIPIVVAAIPGVIYWMSERRVMPYFYAIMWMLWILLVAVIAVHR